MFALLSFVLFAAVTVAVDLGSRYSEAAKIQRAADAAALAAVTALPKGFDAAEAEARQVAARNGYDDADADIAVIVTPRSAETIEVSIQNSAVPTYFADAFGGTTSITRIATAEYIRAVSLGSPRNFLGTGGLLGGGGSSGEIAGGDMRRVRRGVPASNLSESATQTLRENYWLAISGTCSSKENGDRFNTVTKANYANTGNPRGPVENSNPFSCTGASTVPNEEYRGYGYVYAVTVPEGYDAGSMTIQAYDPALCNGSNPGDTSGGGMATWYTVRTGSINPLAGTVLSDDTYWPTADDDDCDDWQDLVTVTPGTEGATYFVQVGAGENTNGGTKSNGFALRADVEVRSSSDRFWVCSSDPVEGSLYAADCPQVSAVNDMGLFANISGSQAEFFLAEVGPEYNGKQLDITLFDPGEGAETLRVKDPNGDYVEFDWEVDCSGGATPPNGGCSGSDTTALDLLGNLLNDSRCRDVDINDDNSPDRCAYNEQPGPRRTSRWKYNERSLTLQVELPDDIGDAYGGGSWWKVEYTTNLAPTDRTTWAVAVQGDPVRLIPNG